MNNSNRDNLPYYAPTAYRPDRIPNQPPSAERSWLKRFGNKRLPWGGTTEVAPDEFMERRGPNNLRFREEMRKQREDDLAAGMYVPAPYEHVDFHDRHDHERFRFALWSKRSQLWSYVYIFGKGWSLIFTPIYILTALAIAAKSRDPYLSALFDLVDETFYATLLPLYSAWALGALVIHKFPKLWVKPSRGPMWELNRRTGLVTVFDYKNNGEYKKNGTIGELTAPFYEFDAYIVSAPDRQGTMNHVLCLAHRYRDIVIDFSCLMNLDDRLQMPCALWDFLQNYMDTSRPLPELPRYEEFRQLDPTTAAYDLKTGRNPRFWIDMDDEAYKKQLNQLHKDIYNINTVRRPNLMALHVRYVD